MIGLPHGAHPQNIRDENQLKSKLLRCEQDRTVSDSGLFNLFKMTHHGFTAVLVLSKPK